MARSDNDTTVSIEDMTKGDRVNVHVNDRAWDHLGGSPVKATVTYVGFDVKCEMDDGRTFTVHRDTGYIMGHHEGLGRVSDIGKARYFTEA